MDAVVRTTAGRVRGAPDEAAFAFLGVPFAAPPFGEHRLLAPVPPEPWDGVRDALAYGPTSQQPEDEIVGGIPEPCIAGEDILTVNVFTPDLGAARLPVLVWIHGGGFTAGSPASPWYRGTRFARDGAVVVTVGYRLGAEGFLALEGTPPNRAVLDWLAALAWVQDNIAAFGGDAGNVTVAGQSAGAVASTTLLSLPRARGLFHRVIAMSGVAAAVSLDQARATARAIADRLGAPATRAAVAALPFARLHAAQLAVQRPDPATSPAADGVPTVGGMLFAPIVDGDLVPDKPLRSIAGGEGGSLDVLAGATHDEAKAMVTRRRPIDEDTLATALAGLGLPPDAYRRLHADLPPLQVLGQAVTDRMFRSRVHDLAEARAAGGGPGRTFTYDFRWQAPDLDLGAVHCIDIPYAFDNLDAVDVGALAGPEPPQALADLVHASWVRFVREGDAGWPAHDLERRQTMLFGVESGPADDPARAERAVWRAGG